MTLAGDGGWQEMPESASARYCWIGTLRLFHRLTISGKQHLRLNGPLIVALNHSSPIDPAHPGRFPEIHPVDDGDRSDALLDTQMIWRFTRIIPTDRRRPETPGPPFRRSEACDQTGSSAFSPKVESPYRQNTSCHSIRAWAHWPAVPEPRFCLSIFPEHLIRCRLPGPSFVAAEHGSTTWG